MALQCHWVFLIKSMIYEHTGKSGKKKDDLRQSNWIGDDFTLFTQRCFKLPGKSRMAESILISCTQCVALGGSLAPQCKYLARAEGPVSAEVGDPHR